MASENLLRSAPSLFVAANDDGLARPPEAGDDVFDLLATPTVLLDRGGVITHANRSWREDPALGARHADGGLRSTYRSVLRDEGTRCAFAAVQRALETGRRAEVVLPWHDEVSERWLSVEATPVAGDRVLVEHRDVTSAQQSARRAVIEARLRDDATGRESLRWLCEVMNWRLAAVWRDEQGADALTLASVTSEAKRAVRAWAMLRETEGVVARARREGAPTFAEATSPCERAMLRECLRDKAMHVRSALAVPSAEGVVSFYATHRRRPDEALLGLLAARFGAGVDATPARAEPTTRERVAVAAMSAAPVLIHGEAHTGKRALAAEIHRRSARCGGPLVSLPREGGLTRLTAAVVEASGGTLVLEDLSALDAPSQRWLCDAMTTGRATTPGGRGSRAFDVRVIACARCSPEALRASMHGELLDRLGVLTVEALPLRARRGELPTLARQVLDEIAAAWSLPAPALSDDAVRALTAMPWEGNLGELRAVLERAWLGVGQVITGSSLAAACVSPRATPATPRATFAATDGDARLASSERDHVERVLQQTDYKMSAAARILGISRSKLYARVNAWRIDLDARRSTAS